MSRSLLSHERLPIRHLLLYGWLPSVIKIWAYRTFRGYRIGKNVKLSFGSVIEAKEVDLGDHVEIGLMTILTGRTIRIGRHSSIGIMCYLSCPRIEIGEDAKIREQVSISGPMLPESSFTLGSRTVILQRTSINPTMPVVIGDDSGIGGHCLIFTHSSWLNILHGYPVSYEPVTLGKSVWLPWRVFVMPGATIGDGSVIGANSLVLGNIPSKSLAVGSPAKVIKQAPDFPMSLDATARKNIVAQILKEFDRLLKSEGIGIQESGSLRIYSKNGSTYRLFHLDSPQNPAPQCNRDDTVLSEIIITANQKEIYRKNRVHWLDLEGNSRSEAGNPMTEELALFLGRYGIRLERDRH